MESSMEPSTPCFGETGFLANQKLRDYTHEISQNLYACYRSQRDLKESFFDNPPHGPADPRAHTPPVRARTPDKHTRDTQDVISH